MTEPLTPEQCQSMDEVRAGVDAVDQAIVALLDTRFAYMRAAARIKKTRAAVRDEGRKAAVLAAVRAEAAARGLPAQALADWWEQLVELSIAYELDCWDGREK